MTADELRSALVTRAREIDTELRRRELLVRKCQEDHHAVIETLRRQYDALAYLFPLIDDAMEHRPIIFDEEDDAYR